MSDTPDTPDDVHKAAGEAEPVAADGFVATPVPDLAQPLEVPAAAPSAAPAPTVVPPAPAKPSKFEHIEAQMESVAALVLDAGELAGRSAQASLALGGELKAACGDLEKITQAGQKKLQWLLIAAVSAMFISMLFFMIMGVRMVSRIGQLDAMVTEVGKKVIELNAGLTSLDTVNATLTEMAQRQEALKQASTEIEGRIESSLKQSEALVQQLPAQTAQQVAATSENLVKQVQGINSRLQTQSSAVQTLAKDVQSLKGSVGNVDKLNRDVQALVTLQRERYLEALQKNQAASAAASAAAVKEASPPPAPPRERALQYPRVPPPGASAPAAGASDANGGSPR